MSNGKPQRHLPEPLRREVFARWGTSCWLGFPGCTGRATECDHVMPYSTGGLDLLGNLRPSCKHCNVIRSNRVLYGYGARIHMLLVPPGACDREAVQWIDGHAKPSDPVVSFESISKAMRVPHGAPYALSSSVALAWSAAYRSLATCTLPVDVWMVRTSASSRRNPRLLDEWIVLDYDITVIDPGMDAIRGRFTGPIMERLIHEWYNSPPSSDIIAARQEARRRQLATFGLMNDTKAVERPEW